MADTLYLRLGHQPETALHWYGDGRSGQARLSDVAALIGTARLVVLAPATPMLCLQAAMPSLKGTRLQQALPFALEDQLAEEVETLHFAPGPRSAEGIQSALVLARAQMQQWLALLAQQGLRPREMYNETLALPLQPQAWTLLLQDDEVLLRTGPQHGQAVPQAQWQDWLQLAWLSRDPEISGIYVYDARSQTSPPEAEQLPANIPMLAYQAIHDPLALMARTLASENPINLLSGEFSMREQLGKLWRPWRAASVLLGLWLLLQAGMGAVQYQQLKQQDQALYQAILDSYRSAVPEAVNIVNPRVQMERHLATLRGSGGHSPFVSLLNRSAPLLAASEGLQLRNLRYRQDELELELELANLAQLDSLKEQLEQQALRVEIRGATSRDNRVEARLALREGGV
ncbi:MAG: type II secretion system protein GspL [Thiohalomonadaceae bacterium]